ncbi:TetR/AcrR family transcriptional regulator [Lichenihabitans sp. Uapishka_5]|uniref:TetR/AcrR family transcriptional regulator n=1 Tax=Lichenihabitans sp. Uapishka_5 TaxID=3037302 RepID=UPI0029E81753|nr:TetR/AcrR family transcriptional regulator [Lichenihabitans sp. Uapishka_5]MDX7953785.1 TetR/AcrR family transcriptional regulator [Lichenihabitans sp. Uapishka_5]
MTSVAPKTSYHHGDLRSALIAAAEQLVAEQAGKPFTLREVARVAGVSHNAPYNHFADRRALLAAIATRGFDDLTASLQRDLAVVDAKDVAAGILATAKSYVAYAVAYPARYQLMFSAELAGCEDGALKAAGERAFKVLQETIARGVSSSQLRRDPLGTHALTAWSLVHGFATLVLDGRVPIPPGHEALAALSDTIAATLIDGLADGRS